MVVSKGGVDFVVFNRGCVGLRPCLISATVVIVGSGRCEFAS